MDLDEKGFMERKMFAGSIKTPFLFLIWNTYGSLKVVSKNHKIVLFHRIFKDCLEVANFLIGKMGEVTACEVGLIERLTQLHGEAVKLADEINSMYNPHGGFF